MTPAETDGGQLSKFQLTSPSQLALCPRQAAEGQPVFLKLQWKGI